MKQNIHIMARGDVVSADMSNRIFIKNKRLKESSKKWLRRHLTDPYVARAKEEGYRSRAAYKLLEINEKFNILGKNNLVIDLGAAPGGWSQVASIMCGKVIAVDLLDMDPIDNVTFIRGNFLDGSTIIHLQDKLEGKAPTIILSDMAPSTCGIRKVDHIRIMNLIEEVFEFAKTFLAEDGTMVAKVFQGGTEPPLLRELQKHFSKIHHFKPRSSRKESSEMYLVAVGFQRK
ncbi:MAG: RlmE family RNA methyltransferase [Holosporales bacterium]|jgi:23S rRNA (uridine2552-2'-O)-methyltransferase|nr:RlmE family RNA methyltransferase [Holosporales bacterium]